MRRLSRRIFFFREKKQKTSACGLGKKTERTMAIYHLEAKVITRGVGRSACGAAAYMSCSRLYNDYDGIQHDYTRKGGLVWEHVFLPTMAPAAWQDRETLWNTVEAAEKTKDSRLAREFVPALPVELNPEQWKELLTDFIQSRFVAEGMCADVAIHDPAPHGHNPHAHILLTVRPLDKNGSWQHKTEKEYLCVRDGKEQGFTAAEFKAAQAEGWEKQYLYQVGKERLYLPPSVAKAQGFERVNKYPYSTKYGRQNPISARWNGEEQLVSWRAAWADAVNRSLVRYGFDARVDHRSHAARGLDEKPTVHEGVSTRKMEAAGHVSDCCELNRQIRADNALIRTLKAAVQKLKSVVETTIPALASAMETVRQNIIVFNYSLLHIRGRKKETDEYMTKARKQYNSYLDLHSQIRVKLDERKALQTELDCLGLLSIGRRKELKTQFAALVEEIEELRFEEESIVQGFGKEDAAGMKQVKSEISGAEAGMVKLGKDETALTVAIGKETEKFAELKEQAAGLDRAELTDARLALRPQMETQAKERIRGAMSSGKVSFWNYQISINDADMLLGENGMAEQREYEKQQEILEAKHELFRHKERQQEAER